MKNNLKTYSFVLICLLLSLIIYLNINKSSSINSYKFKRIFSNNIILNFNKSYFIQNLKEGIFLITTNDSLIYTFNSYTDSSQKLNYSIQSFDYNLNLKKKTYHNIPKYSNILFTNSTTTIYTNLFSLFFHDNENQLNRKINLTDFKVFKIYPLKKNHQFVCLGELKHDGKYKTGLFIIDSNQQKISQIVAVFESNLSTSASQNFLRYSGEFTQSSNQIIYCCDKFSKVYVTDINGENYQSFSTDDKTPLPQVINNLKGTFFYKRGATWGVNYGIFSKQDKYYVFSARSIIKDSLILDVYSKFGSKYLFSSKLYYKNKVSSDISRVYFYNNRIIIAFDDSFASFVYSG